MSDISAALLASSTNGSEPLLPSVVTKMVNKGIKLARAIAKATEELEGLKKSFREDAKLKVASGAVSSPVVYLGTIGSCQVTLKKDSMKLTGGKDLASLESLLPTEVFLGLFDVQRNVTIVTPGKDFNKKLEKISPAHKAIVLAMYTPTPNTPSVEFSK